MDFFAFDQIPDLVATSTIAFAQLLVSIRRTTARSRDLTAWSAELHSTSRRLCRPIIRGGSGANTLRWERTRDKVRCGGLPVTFKRHLWVGPGSDKPCTGCGETIGRKEREFEIIFADTLTFLLHAEFYQAWVSMPRPTQWTPSPPSSAEDGHPGRTRPG